ncbi:MAG: SH3 domain-containing protein [Gammaproteobacteria bacterium]
MDYVNRKMEQARQQRMEEKIAEAMNRQKSSQQDTQDESSAGFTHFKQNTFLVLLGIVAGVAIAATIGWMRSGEPGIDPSSQNIDLLNKRVELLDNSITSLEVKLTRLLLLVDTIKDIDNTQVSERTDTIPATNSMQPAAVEPESTAANREAGFTPTHIVVTKLNLRPSASLNTTPIGILSPGTSVEKISENGDWYYVNTEADGTGWCSSGYLSPL